MLSNKFQMIFFYGYISVFKCMQKLLYQFSLTNKGFVISSHLPYYSSVAIPEACSSTTLNGLYSFFNISYLSLQALLVTFPFTIALILLAIVSHACFLSFENVFVLYGYSITTSFRRVSSPFAAVHLNFVCLCWEYYSL